MSRRRRDNQSEATKKYVEGETSQEPPQEASVEATSGPSDVPLHAVGRPQLREWLDEADIEYGEHETARELRARVAELRK